uniref:DNA/pantothenate metabolism flavoprotein C-terminal domain-containing protein n=1 Tax=Panagrolaimus sp. JU765 TaxID=591449 RepID=A0AC34QV57_9BILA
MLIKQLRSFLEHHKNEDSKIVVISSGGTAVPLEKNSVRFIENFSNGTRGATSAEKFLEKEYLVIFFHRHNTLQPFSHRFPDLFNHLEISDKNDGTFTAPSYPRLAEMINLKNKYQKRILMIPFTTYYDYKNDLEIICKEVASYGKKLCIYLAAAVSDFYIDSEQLPEHKIPSVHGDLNLKLTMTPKVLGKVVQAVVPDAFIVSFKLETDPKVLISKSVKALNEYGHQIVIANMLKTRKRKVTFVRPNNEILELDLDSDEHKNRHDIEIEDLIVEELHKLHEDFIRG